MILRTALIRVDPKVTALMATADRLLQSTTLRSCQLNRHRSRELALAQSTRPMERTFVPKWHHQSPTSNRMYSEPLSDAECATLQAPSGSYGCETRVRGRVRR